MVVGLLLVVTFVVNCITQISFIHKFLLQSAVNQTINNYYLVNFFLEKARGETRKDPVAETLCLTHQVSWTGSVRISTLDLC
jgi:hypothetical protein